MYPPASEEGSSGGFLFSPLRRNPTFETEDDSRKNAPLFSPASRNPTLSFDVEEGSRNSAPQLSEIVFDCLKADGLDLAKVPPDQRSLAFQVNPGSSGFSCVVGREIQVEFFERVVPRKELLACISRKHFELRLDRGAAYPTLRKLSRNPLHLNNLPIGPEATALLDKSLLGFKGMHERDPCFLILCVTFRGRDALAVEGPHPSLTPRADRPRGRIPQPRSASLPPVLSQRSMQRGIGAVLECVSSTGANLAALSANAKVIPLPLDADVEIGRHCQFEVFGHVLQGAQQLLALISRKHIRVNLTSAEPPAHVPGAAKVAEHLGSSSNRGRACWLLVENISRNAVRVDGHILGKGKTRAIAEGAIVAFVCPSNDSGEQAFLEFRLRRARLTLGM